MISPSSFASNTFVRFLIITTAVLVTMTGCETGPTCKEGVQTQVSQQAEVGKGSAKENIEIQILQLTKRYTEEATPGRCDRITWSEKSEKLISDVQIRFCLIKDSPNTWDGPKKSFVDVDRNGAEIIGAFRSRIISKKEFIAAAKYDASAPDGAYNLLKLSYEYFVALCQ